MNPTNFNHFCAKFYKDLITVSRLLTFKQILTQFHHNNTIENFHVNNISYDKSVGLRVSLGVTWYHFWIRNKTRLNIL